MPLHPEQQELGHVSEIKPNAASVWPPVLADLVPNDVCLISESPSFHDIQSFKQEGVRTPEIEMAFRKAEFGNWEVSDFLEGERFVTM
jgi:hypothetical protein